ncbi:MAG: DUF255 domain-containing protein [Armatimonadetes bacterium]|nr:DUF255 domain-containing protein [Armatimonadota bacterium]
MSPYKQKPLFPFATATVVIVSLLGLGLNFVRPLVPRSGKNTLVAGEEDYLSVGTEQPIPWRNLDPTVFVEAKRREMPIMLVCGDVCDRAARQVDRDVFGNREITAWIRTNFIPVRVDLSQFPSWRDTYMQLYRTRSYVNPNFHIWFLTPSGKTFSSVKITNPGTSYDAAWFTQIIRRVQVAFREIQSKRSSTVPGEAQKNDREALINSPELEPDMQAYAQLVIKEAVERRQNRAAIGANKLPVSQIAFLLQIGLKSEAQSILDEFLSSSLVDWTDGGFFTQANRNDLTMVETDKFSVENAEILQILSVMSAETGSPYYAELARRTFDCLAEQFAQGEIVRGYRVSDQDRTGRSPRSSYSPSFLRRETSDGLNGFFASADRDWIRANLGLTTETNRQMLIRISDPNVLLKHSEKFEEIMAKMRIMKKSADPVYGGERQLSTAATCAARMLRSARILDDKARMSQAIRLAEKTGVFRLGVADVIHTFRANSGDYSELQDYLAYADAKLEEYLMLGNLASLEDGTAVLRRALSLFALGRNGCLARWIPPGTEDWPPDIVSPGLADTLGASTTATSIRLCFGYSAVLRMIDSSLWTTATATELRQFAHDAVQVFGGPAQAMGTRAGAYYNAAYREMHAPVVVVKGPDAVDQASALCRLLPTTFVAPLVGKLRDPWTRQPNGYYTVIDETIQGPFTQDQMSEKFALAR